MPSSMAFAGKRALVTGGCGSIGSQVISKLLGMAVKEVVSFDRDEISQFLLSESVRDKRLKTVVGDVADESALERVFEARPIDLVYHAAAVKHVGMCEANPTEAIRTNIEGTRCVVDQCLHSNVKALLMISTDKAVMPISVIGSTKFIAERIVIDACDYARHDQSFSCVRLGNVANSSGSAIPVMVSSLLRHGFVKITDPRVTRYLMTGTDAANFSIKASTLSRGGEIFIPVMRAFVLERLAALIKEVLETKTGRKFDGEPVSVGLEPYEKMDESIVAENEFRRLRKVRGVYVIKGNGHNRTRESTSSYSGSFLSSSRFAKPVSDGELRKIIKEYVDWLWSGKTGSELSSNVRIIAK